jgi:hypothetical protein
VILRGNHFGSLGIPDVAWFGPQYDIRMEERTANPINYILSDRVFVYDHNGVAGNNFRVYYTSQAPDAIVPQTAIGEWDNEVITGAPIAGLTNSQSWAQYGIAVAGEVAPADATTMNRVNGLVKSF